MVWTGPVKSSRAELVKLSAVVRRAAEKGKVWSGRRSLAWYCGEQCGKVRKSKVAQVVRGMA